MTRAWPLGVTAAVAVLGEVADVRGAGVPIPVAASAVVLFAAPGSATIPLGTLLPAHVLSDRHIASVAREHGRPCSTDR